MLDWFQCFDLHHRKCDIKSQKICVLCDQSADRVVFMGGDKALYLCLGLKTPKSHSLNTQGWASKERYMVVTSQDLKCSQKSRPRWKVADFYSCVPSWFLMTCDDDLCDDGGVI